MSTYDLFINQGETTTLGFPVLDANGVPVVVTGWTARVQVRPRADVATVLAQWSTDDTDADLTCIGTTVALTILGSASAAWTWRQGAYDVLVINPANTPSRIAEGQLYLDPAVTR